jgi:hypothetical protein
VRFVPKVCDDVFVDVTLFVKTLGILWHLYTYVLPGISSLARVNTRES